MPNSGPVQTPFRASRSQQNMASECPLSPFGQFSKCCSSLQQPYEYVVICCCYMHRWVWAGEGKRQGFLLRWVAPGSRVTRIALGAHLPPHGGGPHWGPQLLRGQHGAAQLHCVVLLPCWGRPHLPQCVRPHGTDVRLLRLLFFFISTEFHFDDDLAMSTKEFS